MYFDKLIFSSCGIKEHPAAMSVNEDTNSIQQVLVSNHDVLTRRVTRVIFTPCDRCFDSSGNCALSIIA